MVQWTAKVFGRVRFFALGVFRDISGSSCRRRAEQWGRVLGLVTNTWFPLFCAFACIEWNIDSTLLLATVSLRDGSMNICFIRCGDNGLCFVIIDEVFICDRNYYFAKYLQHVQ